MTKGGKNHTSIGERWEEYPTLEEGCGEGHVKAEAETAKEPSGTGISSINA